MRNIIILLLLFLACNRNSIRSVPLELPGVNAVERINETSKVTITLIGKYDLFLRNTDLDIMKVDTELSRILLMQKDEYLILAQEKCPTDSNNKYWKAEFTFGTKGTKSDLVKKEVNENPDSIKSILVMNGLSQMLASDPMKRIAILKSNYDERTKLRLAFAEYKYQLLSIKKRKYDCNFRSSLLYSYLLLVKFFLIIPAVNE